MSNFSDDRIILVISDEIQVRRFLRARFELEGFSVQEAGTGKDGLRCAILQPPIVLILDTDLPDMDAAEVLGQLRSWSIVPVIVISRHSNEAEMVRLFEEGADDYVVKPFGIAELVARTRVAIRRYAASSEERNLPAGALTIELSSRTVIANGSRVALTLKEYMLLQVLAENLDKIVTYKFLLNRIWGSDHLDDFHYLRIFVRRLRRKIEKDPSRPRILLTERGVGYRLVGLEANGASGSI